MPVDLGNGTMATTVGDLLDRMPNPRAVIGDNQPPEPTPLELTAKEVNDLYEEAKLWLDGEPIATAGQASEVGELRKRIQAAAKTGEERRVAEAKPFDEAKKKVQDAYNPLIHKDKGKTALALSALNTALAPYLAELDRQQRAEAAALRAKQVEAERVAREASQAAAQSANLAQREEAERLQDEAKAIAKTANQAEKARAQVHATGGGRAIGMKSVWTPTLEDPAAALAYFRQMRPAELKEWMLGQASDIIRVGPKPPGSIPGFRIAETKQAV